jgi:TetR/AcrR family transcriptional repressor of lmrAB and yxaGH operons
MKNKSDSMREKVLATATRLFQTQGYNATGIKEILEESGSPKGCLYYYFPNGKEELALEAIKLATDFIKRTVRQAFDKYSDPADGIQYIIEMMIKDLEQENKNFGLSVSLIALETYSTNGKLSNACKEAFIALEEVFSEKLMESGYDRAGVQELSMMIQIIIEGALIVSAAKKDTRSLVLANKQINALLKQYN